MSMLEQFLDAKPLYYDEIDYSRMPRIYGKVKNHFKLPKIVHLIGTNGKGTTGRFLASALFSLGYSTGHYTSPHITSFNERIWINSQEVDDKSLDKAHNQLLEILDKTDADSLSYFEYTTLLAMLLFEGLEYVVLEAGLGGEHDATAVFDKSLTLVTPIDRDHEAFLGSSIKSIVTTKLNAIQNYAIIAKQSHIEVYDIANDLAKEKSLKISKVDDAVDKQDYEKIYTITKDLALSEYLVENLTLSIAALKFFKISYKPENFHNSKLFGRLTQFKPNVLIDVGHNTLAANAILNTLKGKKYILVYNSYKDKNYKEIFSILKPIIKHVEIIIVNESRIEKRTLIEDALLNLEIDYKTFNAIQESEEYLVFGSFSVVEEFLRAHNE